MTKLFIQIVSLKIYDILVVAYKMTSSFNYSLIVIILDKFKLFKLF